jgi:hypothetical protein
MLLGSGRELRSQRSPGTTRLHGKEINSDNRAVWLPGRRRPENRESLARLNA